jgi:hypothetical protein
LPTSNLRVISVPLATHLPTDICHLPPDLALVVDAWPTLPEPIRAGIMAMVKASQAPAPASRRCQAEHRIVEGDAAMTRLRGPSI